MRLPCASSVFVRTINHGDCPEGGSHKGASIRAAMYVDGEEVRGVLIGPLHSSWWHGLRGSFPFPTRPSAEGMCSVQCAREKKTATVCSLFC